MIASKTERKIAIVGGGPMCTYALERLAALLLEVKVPVKLRISVFERTGRFGAGEAHSDIQSPTSYMNRIAGQIAFAADETNLDSSKLLPKSLRPTFLEWCLRKYAETGDDRFNFRPEETPRRYLHGLALRDMFQCYMTLLKGIEGVEVDLYVADVTDVSRQSDVKACYIIHTGGTSGGHVPADYILFVTGHSYNLPAPDSTTARLASFSESMPEALYIPRAYPLEEYVSGVAVPPGSTVGVHGLGLTAIDIFLYLTEGRGGTFIPVGQPGPLSKLQYVPSGREPALIVGFSPSGMLTSARPLNAKDENPAREYKGQFFTVNSIRALRRAFGRPVVLTCGRRTRQLDFERHVFPLVILEMAFVYYKALLGEKFGGYLRSNVESRYRSFLLEGCLTRDAGVDYLLEPVNACFEEAAAYINLAAQGEPIPDFLRQFETIDVFGAFTSTVFGISLGLAANDIPNGAPPGRTNFEGLISPWGHSPNVYDHRFDWRTVFDPLTAEAHVSGSDWRDEVIAYMKKDHMNAAQNNLKNPVKAACDGVWRDLRAVFSETADLGGLLPESHRHFMSTYLRYYNRLSNGAGLEPMRKILALIEHGLLDISVGPAPVIEPSPSASTFRIRGTRTETVREVNVIIEGKTHPFNPEMDINSLYPNLIRRELVRKWRNPGQSSSEDFYPGGLDLSDDFHPVQRDETVEQRLTFLGSPAEGVRFFQQSAARPHSNSYILNNVALWADGLLEAIFAGESQAPTGTGIEHAADANGVDAHKVERCLCPTQNSILPVR